MFRHAGFSKPIRSNCGDSCAPRAGKATIRRASFLFFFSSLSLLIFLRGHGDLLTRRLERGESIERRTNCGVVVFSLEKITYPPVIDAIVCSRHHRLCQLSSPPSSFFISIDYPATCVDKNSRRRASELIFAAVILHLSLGRVERQITHNANRTGNGNKGRRTRGDTESSAYANNIRR